MIPKYCQDCRSLHTGGRKETKYARWCCKHSGDTQKVWKHCKENGGKTPKIAALYVQENGAYWGLPTSLSGARMARQGMR